MRADRKLFLLRRIAEPARISATKSANATYLGPGGGGAEVALEKADRIKCAWQDGNATEVRDYEGLPTTVWLNDADRAVCQFRHRHPLRAGRHAHRAAGVRTTPCRHRAARQGRTGNARLKRGIEVLGPDRPLSSVGAAELTAAILALAARPLTKTRPNQKKPARPISVKSAEDYLASLRAFLDEMAKTEAAPGVSDEPLWRRPLRFDDIFRANQPKYTEAEKDRMLAYQASLGVAERPREHRVPLVPHDRQRRLRVPLSSPPFFLGARSSRSPSLTASFQRSPWTAFISRSTNGRRPALSASSAFPTLLAGGERGGRGVRQRERGRDSTGCAGGTGAGESRRRGRRRCRGPCSCRLMPRIDNREDRDLPNPKLLFVTFGSSSSP